MRGILALGLWIAAVLSSPGGARAAEPVPSAALEAATRYTLTRDADALSVTIHATFRNTSSDTAEGRLFYTGYTLALQPGARGVAVTSAGRSLAATAVTQADRTEVTVDFGRQVRSGESLNFQVGYTLPDVGRDAAPGEPRVGRAFVAVTVQAFGDPGGSVELELPAGFSIAETAGEPMSVVSGGTGVLLRAAPIDDPTRWASSIAATREAELAVTTLDITVPGGPARFEIRAWPEDAEWQATVTDRLSRGVPILQELIGTDWNQGSTIRLTETYAPLIGGYAGTFEHAASTDGGEIRLTEQLDDHLILHELAHAWLNRDLLRDRWLFEGLAEEYAARALDRMGLAHYAPRAVSLEDREAFDLATWGAPSRVTDEAELARERWGYDASWHVVRELLDEIGPGGMRDVLEAAAAGPGPADRRSMLDLLEDRADSRRAVPLWEAWVTTDAEDRELRRRADARTTYAWLKAAGRDWAPPQLVRGAMSAWRFDDAETAMGDAFDVLRTRGELEMAARELGVSLPPGLETAYEEAAEDLGAARALAEEQLRTMEELGRAGEVARSPRDLVLELGLLGEPIDGTFDAAIEAFEGGDLESARALAGRVEPAHEETARRGNARLLIGVGAAFGGLALTTSLLAWRVIRRRRRAAPDAVAPPEGLLHSPPPQPDDPPTPRQEVSSPS